MATWGRLLSSLCFHLSREGKVGLNVSLTMPRTEDVMPILDSGLGGFDGLSSASVEVFTLTFNC